MKVIEVEPAVPNVLRLFLEAQPRRDFLAKATEALAREKASHYATVNKFLESEISQAGHLLEALADFQSWVEEERELSFETEKQYRDLKEQVQQQSVELHRAKVKLTDVKISVCRFIAAVEAPRKASKALRSLEEWMDAATMAEMRLSRTLEVNPDPARQQFLSLFTTFRSVLCSFDGPSQFLRQLEAAWASLEALHEKVLLETDVMKSAERLEQTRQELSTVKLDLTSLQSRLQTQAQQAGHLEVRKKSLWSRLLPAVIILAAGIGAYLYLRNDAHNMHRRAGSVITEASCQEIAEQIAHSPRYAGQVLIFRKFGQDVYFSANAMTCEKLHRLDSTQVAALAALLQLDYEKGNQQSSVFNGHRVLQVKDVGINKLVVDLANPTNDDVEFKLRVLELATLLKAVLQSDPAGDALIVDLPPQTSEP